MVTGSLGRPRLSSFVCAGLRKRLATDDFAQVMIDVQAALPRKTDHEVGSLRGATDSQHSIAVRQEPFGDRVEDLVERFVSNPLRAGERDQRRREPLAKNGRTSLGSD